MVTNQKRLVACPQCKQLSEYSPANKYRPFCSERCRLIDLGQWASESYRIPEKDDGDDFTDAALKE
jgi:endogenous inhibitor of DNA gyrase (YacG/DUF329 family)